MDRCPKIEGFGCSDGKKSVWAIFIEVTSINAVSKNKNSGYEGD